MKPYVRLPLEEDELKTLIYMTRENLREIHATLKLAQTLGKSYREAAARRHLAGR